MMSQTRLLPILTVCFLMIGGAVQSQTPPIDYSPKADEQQLPKKMHSAMEESPVIKVGQKDGDLIGRDNRALQAAVDYIAGLGGGVVEIGEGIYAMRDSLHLRSNVIIRGVEGKTVLRKSSCASSLLAIDGDYGEEQITLQNPEGFDVGCGAAVWDDDAGGFHVVVARITGKRGNTVSISKPLGSDYMIHRNAKAATIFPVVSGYDVEGARVENLVIDGNKEENEPLGGCRGAGIFLYRGFGTVIQNCHVKNYNGDGISFQQSNDVQVIDCISENNAQLGFHPGSGSQRPVVKNCIARGNGADGLFLCWRVRHGLFENNLLEENGRFGISIGHKDSDNLLRKNQVRLNKQDGVFFRNETLGMAGHRNRLEDNIIENNGTGGEGAGIRIRGETNGTVIINNMIRDTRPPERQTQTTGIRIEEKAGDVLIENNRNESKEKVIDLRKKD
ncbi:MAG: right-handed parallel beta-helix repeat-containing protein [Candidatus Omnitrophica bacterium]|nr:right-handed parallel beta-helix repeat-containing protein [Candidatus Omnitrophota bacterium]